MHRYFLDAKALTFTYTQSHQLLNLMYSIFFFHFWSNIFCICWHKSKRYLKKIKNIKLLQLLLTYLYKNKKYAASPINNTPFLVISVKVIICNYKCQSVLVIIHNLLAYLQFPITPLIQKSHHLSSSRSWALLILLRGWLLQNIDNINE